MGLKKSIISLIIVCLIGCVLCGCEKKANSNDYEDLPEIKIGNENYPPFSYMDENGKPTGIDVDIATEAFKRLGYRAEFVNIKWEEKKTLLENGDIDCIWNCFSIKGRENEYKWTKPYMVSRHVVAVNKSSNIYSLSDLKDKVIAVQSTTKPEELFLNNIDSRIPEVKEIFCLEDRDLIYTYLGKGYVDAIAAHEISIRQYMQDYDMDYRILDESLFVTGIGAAFALNDDRGIEEKLSEELEEMRKDGTTERILSKYLANAYKYLEVDSLE